MLSLELRESKGVRMAYKRSARFSYVPRLSCPFLVLVVCLFSAATIRAQDPTPTPPEDPSSPVRIKTDLVTLTLTVTDPYDRYVSGLDKSAFTITDNNQEQEISFFSDSDAPVSVG